MIVTDLQNPPSPQHQIRRSDGSLIKRGSSNYLRSLRTAKIALVFYSVLSITCLQLGSLFTSQQRRFLSRLIMGRNSADDEYNMITPPPACDSVSSITRLLLGPSSSSTMCDDSTTKRDDLEAPTSLTTTTHYLPPSSPVSDPQPTRHVDSSPVTQPVDDQGKQTKTTSKATDAATSKSKTLLLTNNHSIKKNHLDGSSMRACIFVRNDNHLLAEWIAYHYTVLPLRHLIIGCDEDAVDDPMEVLQQWNETDLGYEIWHPQDYSHNLTYPDQNPLSRFRRRQPHFMSKCMQHFYNTGHRGWLALVDTDEYITLNPLDDATNEQLYNNNNKNNKKNDKKNDKNSKPTLPVSARIMKESERYMAANETVWDRVNMRKELRRRLGLDPFVVSPTLNHSSHSNESLATIPTNTEHLNIPTVLEVLEEYSAQHGTLPCHTMSRLRYSAVQDNYTALSQQLCRPQLHPEVTAQLNTTQLSTIRFLYHAAPQHWKHNEWAKVLIDLRRVSAQSLANVANPHQPLKDMCKGTYAHDMISFIRANHYINDLSVFAGRKGDTRRRNTADWEKMAYLRDGVRCDHMHDWLNQLVDKLGMDKVKQVLLK